jgi:hypothetical protein
VVDERCALEVNSKLSSDLYKIICENNLVK